MIASSVLRTKSQEPRTKIPRIQIEQRAYFFYKLSTQNACHSLAFAGMIAPEEITYWRKKVCACEAKGSK
jgi:hypothetical protein